MTFTSLDYLGFVVATFAVYWILPGRRWQNLLLLSASYLFYAYVHHWFAALLAGTTLVNYLAARLMARYPAHRRRFLAAAVTLTLLHLGVFKYFDFFAENVRAAAEIMGLSLGAFELGVVLPVGISFYSFQSLSYTIDVSRGKLAARRSLLDVALFISFFPQLVAGPIERAGRLLKQIEEKRAFRADRFASAWPLLVSGFFKKLVIADNVSIFADKVFMLAHPSPVLLIAGSLAFTLQIYADFSAYTDIARGSARLFGIELMKNFDSPYLAVSPSDFWRRWHISFSTWIRDYLYIPLGGSKKGGAARGFVILVVSLGLSGLWHGAAWHFVAWGAYHAILLFGYRMLGLGGRWRPRSLGTRVVACVVMFAFTVIGWAVFRAPDLGWLLRAFGNPLSKTPLPDVLLVSSVIVLWTALYAVPLLLLRFVEGIEAAWKPPVRGAVLGILCVLIFVFIRDSQQDFIYFQF